MSIENIDDDTLRIELLDGTLHSAQACITSPVGTVKLEATGEPDTVMEGVKQLYSCLDILDEVLGEETAAKGAGAAEKDADTDLPNIRYGDKATVAGSDDG